MTDATESPRTLLHLILAHNRVGQPLSVSVNPTSSSMWRYTPAGEKGVRMVSYV